jgi:hypothetical protein
MCASVNSSHLSDEEYDSIKLLDKRVVASALGVSVRTAEGWANGRPGGPECIRVGGCVKWPLYRSRFLGHGCCGIGPDLQGALVGDRRSSANCVRRVFVTPP